MDRKRFYRLHLCLFLASQAPFLRVYGPKHLRYAVGNPAMEAKVFTSSEQSFNHRLASLEASREHLLQIQTESLEAALLRIEAESRAATSLSLWCACVSYPVIFATSIYFSITEFQRERALHLDLVLLLLALALPMFLSLAAAWAIVQRPTLLYKAVLPPNAPPPKSSALLLGMGTVLNLGGVPFSTNGGVAPDDADALAGDWAAVGQDIEVALAKFRQSTFSS